MLTRCHVLGPYPKWRRSFCIANRGIRAMFAYLPIAREDYFLLFWKLSYFVVVEAMHSLLIFAFIDFKLCFFSLLNFEWCLRDAKFRCLAYIAGRRIFKFRNLGLFTKHHINIVVARAWTTEVHWHSFRILIIRCRVCPFLLRMKPFRF